MVSTRTRGTTTCIGGAALVLTRLLRISGHRGVRKSSKGTGDSKT